MPKMMYRTPWKSTMWIPFLLLVLLSPGSREASSGFLSQSFLSAAVGVGGRGAIGVAAAVEVSSSRTNQESSSSSSSKSNLQQANTTRKRSWNEILGKALMKGLGGGLPGAIAGVVQVLAFMGLRTVMNYQMRYGTAFTKAVDILYKEGGIARFYRGLGFALVQAPLSRFVSTAANDAAQAVLEGFDIAAIWGPGLSTMIGALVVGVARILLMPVDTLKTVLQVDGTDGFRGIMERAREGNIGVLYQGAIANAVSSSMAHYPWFFTFNYLSKLEWINVLIPSHLLKNAFIGIAASIASDTVVNSLRVLKTTKQSLGSKRDLSYFETIQMVLAADGWKGLFGRGLRTRIYVNALQSLVFTVIWRGLAERWQAPKTQPIPNHATPNHTGPKGQSSGEKEEI